MCQSPSGSSCKSSQFAPAHVGAAARQASGIWYDWHGAPVSAQISSSLSRRLFNFSHYCLLKSHSLVTVTPRTKNKTAATVRCGQSCDMRHARQTVRLAGDSQSQSSYFFHDWDWQSLPPGSMLNPHLITHHTVIASLGLKKTDYELWL